VSNRLRVEAPEEVQPNGRALRRRTGAAFMTLGIALLVLAAVFLGYSQYVSWQLSHVVMLAEAAPLPDPLPPVTEVAAQIPVTPKPLAPAQRIQIGSIQLDAKVVELGTHEEKGQLVWDTAAHAVGWYRTTALPGQGSNVVMSGHISSPLKGEGSIFRRLPEVTIGDTIVLETSASRHGYRVVSRQIVSPTEIGVMAPTPSETLTLITCYPDLIYSHRLVVQAQPIGG
jgi:LPXTG-site transpeptidase (sortase) family protein